MYQFESRVRYSESNRKQRMKLAAIMNYFQDVTTFEAMDLGYGLEQLENMGAAWMVSSWQVVVNRYPVFGERFIVRTWPYDFKGFLGYRNFTIETPEHEVLVYATSTWIYIDLATLKPKRIPKELLDAYEFSEAYPMPKTTRKIELPDETEQRLDFAVQKFHIDSNQHVNNEKYIMMALEYLPADFVVGQMRAEYKKAAVFGDRIYPRVSISNEKAVVILTDADGASYVNIEFLRKETK